MSADLPPADRRTVEPSAPQFAMLEKLDPERPVIMLNLVRFREVADYSAHPDHAPETPISGAEAYQRYSAGVQAALEEIGGSLEHFRLCAPTFIGPEDEQWDAMLTVRYPSPAAFRTMITNPVYLESAVHRSAAVVDARLIPTVG